MIALQQYSMQVILAFMFLSFTFIMIPRALISARRVAEVLNRNIDIQDPLEPVHHYKILLKVISNLKMSVFNTQMHHKPILKNISFKAKANQTTAFIGSTGSGKSTLIHLIPRFYDVSEGQILIDGIDIKSMKQHDLHTLIGISLNKGTLFSGPLKKYYVWSRKKKF